MSQAIGHDTLTNPENYLVIGRGPDELPTPTWTGSFRDKIWAEQTALAWLVAGFSSRVVDLKLIETTPTLQVPQIVARYDSLMDVQDYGVNKYCPKIQPPFVPHGFTEEQFAEWLVNFSNGTPTWPDQASVSAQAVSHPTRSGVTHINVFNGYTAYCGADGDSEQNHPGERPLKRGELYCPECLGMRIASQDDYFRAHVRMLMEKPPGEEGAGNLVNPVKLWEDDPDYLV